MFCVLWMFIATCSANPVSQASDHPIIYDHATINYNVSQQEPIKNASVYKQQTNIHSVAGKWIDGIKNETDHGIQDRNKTEGNMEPSRKSLLNSSTVKNGHEENQNKFKNPDVAHNSSLLLKHLTPSKKFGSLNELERNSIDPLQDKTGAAEKKHKKHTTANMKEEKLPYHNYKVETQPAAQKFRPRRSEGETGSNLAELDDQDRRPIMRLFKHSSKDEEKPSIIQRIDVDDGYESYEDDDSLEADALTSSEEELIDEASRENEEYNNYIGSPKSRRQIDNFIPKERKKTIGAKMIIINHKDCSKSHATTTTTPSSLIPPYLCAMSLMKPNKNQVVVTGPGPYPTVVIPSNFFVTPVPPNNNIPLPEQPGLPPNVINREQIVPLSQQYPIQQPMVGEMYNPHYPGQQPMGMVNQPYGEQPSPGYVNQQFVGQQPGGIQPQFQADFVDEEFDDYFMYDDPSQNGNGTNATDSKNQQNKHRRSRIGRRKYDSGRGMAKRSRLGMKGQRRKNLPSARSQSVPNIQQRYLNREADNIWPLEADYKTTPVDEKKLQDLGYREIVQEFHTKKEAGKGQQRVRQDIPGAGGQRELVQEFGRPGEGGKGHQLIRGDIQPGEGHREMVQEFGSARGKGLQVMREDKSAQEMFKHREMIQQFGTVRDDAGQEVQQGSAAQSPDSPGGHVEIIQQFGFRGDAQQILRGEIQKVGKSGEVIQQVEDMGAGQQVVRGEMQGGGQGLMVQQFGSVRDVYYYDYDYYGNETDLEGDDYQAAPESSQKSQITQRSGQPLDKISEDATNNSNSTMVSASQVMSNETTLGNITNSNRSSETGDEAEKIQSATLGNETTQTKNPQVSSENETSVSNTSKPSNEKPPSRRTYGQQWKRSISELAPTQHSHSPHKHTIANENSSIANSTEEPSHLNSIHSNNSTNPATKIKLSKTIHSAIEQESEHNVSVHKINAQWKEHISSVPNENFRNDRINIKLGAHIISTLPTIIEILTKNQTFQWNHGEQNGSVSSNEAPKTKQNIDGGATQDSLMKESRVSPQQEEMNATQALGDVGKRKLLTSEKLNVTHTSQKRYPSS